MGAQDKAKPRKIFSPDFLTPEERQKRVVEILARGVLRLIEKKKKASLPEAVTER